MKIMYVFIPNITIIIKCWKMTLICVNKELVLSPVRIRTRTRLQNVVKGNLKKKSGPVYSSIFIISKSEKDANLSVRS